MAKLTFKKTMARNLEYLSLYLEWLRARLVAMLPEEEFAKTKSMNIALHEKLYLRETGLVEIPLLTGNPLMPVIKVITTETIGGALTTDIGEIIARNMIRLAEPPTAEGGI